MQNQILIYGHFLLKWLLISGGGLALMLFYLAPVWAATTEVVGYIGSLDCQSDSFQWKRKGEEELVVEPNKALEVDDDIRVLEKGCSITLMLQGGITLSFDKKPYHRVKKLAASNSNKAENAKNIVFTLWDRLWGKAEPKQKGAHARSNTSLPLDIPLFENNVATLKAGKDVIFGWQNGVAPYTVSVYRHPGKGDDKSKVEVWEYKNAYTTEIASTELQKTGLTEKKFELTPGVYGIEVTDNMNNKKEGTFTVVDKLPSFQLSNQEKQAIQQSPEQRLVCAGFWLEKYQKWELEAYQILKGRGDKEILLSCGLK